MLALVRMTEGEFQEFFDISVEGYAADSVASGRWSAEEAPALARAETARLLPNGANTPETHLFVLRDEELSISVGYLWFATPLRGARRIAFVYHLLILPTLRRRGYGRAAMRALEAEATALGCEALALNVFAGNAAARNLYASIGYSTTSVAMKKELGRDHA